MNIEKPIVIIVVCALFFLGVSNLWDHQIEHDFPYGYYASDTFQQQTRAEGIKDQGNYRLEPSYIVKGYDNVIGYYPPVIHHVGVLMHHASGIPVHDSIYFMALFFAIVAALLMYVLIRSYNRHVALLSLPLTILLFSQKSYIAFIFGHWASVTAQLFLIGVFWASRRIDLKGAGILLGIMFAGLANAHQSELLYGVAFSALFVGLLFFQKKLDTKTVQKLAGGAGIAVLFSWYTLWIFIKSFAATNPYEFYISKDWGGTPIFQITDFGVLLVLMAIGIAISILLFKKMPIPTIAGLLMLAVGYTNYIGFGIRAFQPRLFWPLYLMFFVGLGIYTIIKLIPKQYHLWATLGASLLLLLFTTNVIAVGGVPNYYKLQSPGIMTPWNWEAYNWIATNTPPDAAVYYFYGDGYDQDAILRNGKRFHAVSKQSNLIPLIQNREINRTNGAKFAADHGAGMPYFDGFSIERRRGADTNAWFWQATADICRFDYFVFDKVSGIPDNPFIQYNLLVIQAYIDQSMAQPVYQNDGVVILQKINSEEDCFVRTTF